VTEPTAAAGACQSADWQRLALEPPRVFGGPAGTARLRVEPEDFVVDERLGFVPAGQGSHVLLQVRKRLANTDWVAGALAREAGVRPMDIGFAGFKDRHAVTTQWFTVPLGRRSAESWLGHCGDGYEVLAAAAHTRKLPRGALAGNRFVLRLRDFGGDRARCESLLAEVARRGAPNWFGPQRFGRGLSNLTGVLGARASAAGGDGTARAPRLRGMELSAARSLLFNAVLAMRVEARSWDRLEVGDLANLDGRNSVFRVQQVDEVLAARLVALDLHPTGPLHGAGGPQPEGEPGAIEQRVLAQATALPQAIEAAGAQAARRPLRVALRDLRWAFEDDTLVLGFELRGGSFATAVVREFVEPV
jgi:tRNA pseudouridine13 synthase